MNNRRLQDIVRGRYGRKIAYADVDEINESNVVDVIGKSIGTFYFNREVCAYLWDYKNGDQPVLYREKTIREDVCNKVVENHAYEIVQFKNAQTNGEPIQCVSLKKDQGTNDAVDRFNNYCRGANKHVRDISCGEWMSATGIGFKAVIRKKGEEIPFGIINPTPLNTFIIHSRSTGEPLLAVQEIKGIDNKMYRKAYSKTHEYRIQDGRVTYVGIHAFGNIPIVGYQNNESYISDIELVITMLDAINEYQSNRVDAVEQFVQSFFKFINCEVDPDTFQQMRLNGAFVVKSNNGSENKADVDILTQELNQTQTQIAKDDLWNNAMSILAIPNREGSTGGDTAGAVGLRNGWDFAKQRAKIKDPYIIEAEKRLDTVILNIIRQEKGPAECPLGVMDYDVQISHSPTDNMLTKTQTLQLMLQMGIHPLIAIKTSGLWADAEKVFTQSQDGIKQMFESMYVSEKQNGGTTFEQQEKLANQVAEGQMKINK